ncbi:hypothetical protein L596_021692 [Steinernema carpocapsae]|uniref:Uncharacterized protein n=1 Tax=Steinernema carpocapsae TaxID=34508 RepID=A0A4U5MJJ7_STECR|nr:hypothetical protein L596_021692 [Steinernema carpocapsae]
MAKFGYGKKENFTVVERSRRAYRAQTTIGYDENGVMWHLVEFFVFIASWGRVQSEIHQSPTRNFAIAM